MTSTVYPIQKDTHAQDYVEQLHQTVKSKVETFDPSKTGKETEFTKGEAISLSQLINKYASNCDRLLFISASVFSFILGGSFPIIMVFFGEFTDKLGGSVSGVMNQFSSMDTLVLQMLYVSLAVMTITFFSSYFYNVFSCNVSFFLRIKYFSALMQKDSAWYDNNNPGEMSAKISKEISTI